MEKVVQCGYCGRIGEKVVLNEAKQIIHCNCCGVDTLVSKFIKKDFFEEEPSRLRYLLSEKILYPVENFKEYKQTVETAAENLYAKQSTVDFLADFCRKAIYAERISENNRREYRRGVLETLDNSDIAGKDTKGDLKCTLTFLSFFLANEKGLDTEYRVKLEERFEKLKLAAAQKDILITEIALTSTFSVANRQEDDVELVGGILEISEMDVTDMAYRNEYHIEGVVFTDEVKHIGDSAFDGCSNLKFVSFGSGITAIGGSAFCGTGITKLFIPSNIKKIGACAFRGCHSLAEVTFEAPFGWKAINLYGGEKEIKEKELCGKMAFRSLTDGKKYANCDLIKQIDESTSEN